MITDTLPTLEPPSPCLRLPPDKPKLWRDVVKVAEEDIIVLTEEFLARKINVVIPVGDTEEPSITIDAEVISVLAAAYSSSLVIKLRGTKVPYAIIDKKLRDLWRPSGRMRLVDLPNNYYLVKFETEDDYIAVITGGLWVVFGHYVTIKKWSPSLNPLTDWSNGYYLVKFESEDDYTTRSFCEGLRQARPLVTSQRASACKRFKDFGGIWRVTPFPSDVVALAIFNQAAPSANQHRQERRGGEGQNAEPTGTESVKQRGGKIRRLDELGYSSESPTEKKKGSGECLG
ncbi:hypothetical protein V2J09_023107 [Rumex salicifolius]